MQLITVSSKFPFSSKHFVYIFATRPRHVVEEYRVGSKSELLLHNKQASRAFLISSTVFPTLRTNTLCKFFFYLRLFYIYSSMLHDHKFSFIFYPMVMTPAMTKDSCKLFCFRKMDFVVITNLYSRVKNKMINI